MAFKLNYARLFASHSSLVWLLPIERDDDEAHFLRSHEIETTGPKTHTHTYKEPY